MNTPRNISGLDRCPEEIREYLPLIANGTCPSDKREEIATFLEKNPACAEELAQFETLAGMVREDASRIPAPSDALLSNILGRIETEEKKSSPAFKERLATFYEGLAGWLTPPRLRFATALAVLVIVLQAGIILHQSKRMAAYHTLSGPAAALSGGISLNVVFNPEARIGDIQAFLTKIHGQIAGGPGASGVYTLSVSNAQNRKALLAALRHRKDLFEFIEIKD